MLCNEDVRTKLDVKSTKGIFVGYDRNSPAYLVYYPDSGKVKKCRLIQCLTPNKNENVDHDENIDVDMPCDVQVQECTPHFQNQRSHSHVENVEPQTPIANERPQRVRVRPTHFNDFETGFNGQVSSDYCYRGHWKKM